MSILSCTFAELEAAAEFPALVAEYSAESAIPGMPAPRYDSAKYRQLCKMGLLHTFAARSDVHLIGFMTVVVTVLPHYSVPMAVSESVFVGKAHRMSGAGVRLLQRGEEVAREHGCPGLLVSAPYEGALFEVLPRLGYAETNRIFFKRVQHDG